MVSTHPESTLSSQYGLDMPEQRINRQPKGRRSPEDAGRAFIRSRFPDALVAIVAGSFIRGEDTTTSDLDVMIVTEREEAPFRESFRAFGWPIEAFVHTPESFPVYFRSDVARRTPTLATICAEGIVVADAGGLAERITAQAGALIAAGPPPLSELEREEFRYGLTEALDDLLGTEDRAEGLFIAHQVGEMSATLLLLINNRWIGRGKWLVRALRQFDEGEALLLEAGLSAYCRAGDKSSLADFARATLERAGGPIFEGFYRSGHRHDSS